FALQIARANAKAGRPVIFFSFELEGEVLLTKIVSAEAAEASASSLPLSIYQVRAACEGSDGLSGGLPERLSQYNGGLEALETVSSYAENLVIHRSTTTHTSMDVITGVVKDVPAETGETPLVVVDYLQKVNT